MPESCMSFWVCEIDCLLCFDRAHLLSTLSLNFIFSFQASVIPAVFLLCASYAGCDEMLVVTFFIISVGARGFLAAGLYVNPMDLSPNYAGALISLANGIGALTGVLAPYIVGVLTPHVRFIPISTYFTLIVRKLCVNRE